MLANPRRRELALHVVDEPVGVRRQAEPAERAHDPGEIGRDHPQRIKRQQRQQDATAKAGAFLSLIGRSSQRQLGAPRAVSGPLRLTAPQVFVHEPGGVVAVLESVAGVEGTPARG